MRRNVMDISEFDGAGLMNDDHSNFQVFRKMAGGKRVTEIRYIKPFEDSRWQGFHVNLDTRFINKGSLEGLSLEELRWELYYKDICRLPKQISKRAYEACERTESKKNIMQPTSHASDQQTGSKDRTVSEEELRFDYLVDPECPEYDITVQIIPPGIDHEKYTFSTYEDILLLFSPNILKGPHKYDEKKRLLTIEVMEPSRPICSPKFGTHFKEIVLEFHEMAFGMVESVISMDDPILLFYLDFLEVLELTDFYQHIVSDIFKAKTSEASQVAKIFKEAYLLYGEESTRKSSRTFIPSPAKIENVNLSEDDEDDDFDSLFSTDLHDEPSAPLPPLPTSLLEEEEEKEEKEGEKEEKILVSEKTGQGNETSDFRSPFVERLFHKLLSLRAVRMNHPKSSEFVHDMLQQMGLLVKYITFPESQVRTEVFQNEEDSYDPEFGEFGTHARDFGLFSDIQAAPPPRAESVDRRTGIRKRTHSTEDFDMEDKPMTTPSPKRTPERNKRTEVKDGQIGWDSIPHVSGYQHSPFTPTKSRPFSEDFGKLDDEKDQEVGECWDSFGSENQNQTKVKEKPKSKKQYEPTLILEGISFRIDQQMIEALFSEQYEGFVRCSFENWRSDEGMVRECHVVFDTSVNAFSAKKDFMLSKEFVNYAMTPGSLKLRITTDEEMRDLADDAEKEILGRDKGLTDDEKEVMKGSRKKVSKSNRDKKYEHDNPQGPLELLYFDLKERMKELYVHTSIDGLTSKRVGNVSIQMGEMKFSNLPKSLLMLKSDFFFELFKGEKKRSEKDIADSIVFDQFSFVYGEGSGMTNSQSQHEEKVGKLKRWVNESTGEYEIRVFPNSEFYLPPKLFRFFLEFTFTERTFGISYSTFGFSDNDKSIKALEKQNDKLMKRITELEAQMNEMSDEKKEEEKKEGEEEEEEDEKWQFGSKKIHVKKKYKEAEEIPMIVVEELFLLYDFSKRFGLFDFLSIIQKRIQEVCRTQMKKRFEDYISSFLVHSVMKLRSRKTTENEKPKSLKQVEKENNSWVRDKVLIQSAHELFGSPRDQPPHGEPEKTTKFDMKAAFSHILSKKVAEEEERRRKEEERKKLEKEKLQQNAISKIATSKDGENGPTEFEEVMAFSTQIVGDPKSVSEAEKLWGKNEEGGEEKPEQDAFSMDWENFDDGKGTSVFGEGTDEKKSSEEKTEKGVGSGFQFSFGGAEPEVNETKQNETNVSAGSWWGDKPDQKTNAQDDWNVDQSIPSLLLDEEQNHKDIVNLLNSGVELNVIANVKNTTLEELMAFMYLKGINPPSCPPLPPTNPVDSGWGNTVNTGSSWGSESPEKDVEPVASRKRPTGFDFHPTGSDQSKEVRDEEAEEEEEEEEVSSFTHVTGLKRERRRVKVKRPSSRASSGGFGNLDPDPLGIVPKSEQPLTREEFLFMKKKVQEGNMVVKELKRIIIHEKDKSHALRTLREIMRKEKE